MRAAAYAGLLAQNAGIPSASYDLLVLRLHGVPPYQSELRVAQLIIL